MTIGTHRFRTTSQNNELECSARRKVSQSERALRQTARIGES